jgi:hypothetical protein
VTPTPTFVKLAALGAPAFLLLYGLLRLVDGLDGAHGPGLAWNLGHTMFLVAFCLFGALSVGLRLMVAPVTARKRVVADIATVAALFGAGCFLWVILGDLSASFKDAVPVPDLLEIPGPLLFQIGMLTLLLQLVTTRPPRLPVWTPVLVLLGFVMIAVNLDLLAIGTILIAVGLAPLAVTWPSRSSLTR